jgi:AraC-like DNA-binding protein
MCVEGHGRSREVSFRRIPECGGAEVARAQFSDFAFRKHAHDRVGIGIVTDGAMQVDTPYRSFVAEPGVVMTVNPDTVHWGTGVGAKAWQQHILFLDEESFSETVREMTGKPRRDRFACLSLADPGLWRCFLDVHRTLSESGEALRREDMLLGLVADVVARNAGDPDLPAPGGSEPRAVRLAREWLDAHYAENVTLEQLGALSGVSAFQLSRAFRKTLGMPPHAWQLHRRIRAAENLLRAGLAPADVAADCGFADQAHLTRVFAQANGMTPAQFRAG